MATLGELQWQLFARLPRYAWRPRRQIELVSELAKSLATVSAAELLRRSRDLRWRATTGGNRSEFLADAFALVSEAVRRFAGFDYYPAQLEAGLALASGRVAEMQTGEGKSLAALLPAYLFALDARGCHVVTSNDYLAQRDSDVARHVLALLGLNVGCITAAKPPDDRKAEYDCDITYGTSRELGFDFLRDRLAADESASCRASKATTSQRGHYFALVDEADSVLLDDAVTPLVISQSQERASDLDLKLLEQFADLATGLRPGADFDIDTSRGIIELSHRGKSRLSTRQYGIDSVELYDGVTTALVARHLIERDRDYLVDEQRAVAIIDGPTGRISAGRKWRNGLQQAIELREGVPISAANENLARTTVQTFFRRYQFLAGLTGTASSAAGELRRVYKLRVSAIPTTKPCLRTELIPRIFRRCEAKLEAIASDIIDRQDRGGAVLVGTTSVRSTDRLAELFASLRIEHQVLNCRHHDREAELVAIAGQPGVVTIATNMAGRGTHIEVHRSVIEQGGLHVIVAELGPSARSDRQLIGRTARQGEPGSYQYFLSLADELFASLGADGVVDQLAAATDEELNSSYFRLFRAAQRRHERLAEKRRSSLLKQENAREESCQRIGSDPALDFVD